MPQVTNRSLVGEMAASPVGQGTVYSAMLKVSATNRERAAKVNNCESQRLQKINKVIDKGVHYTRWKAGQEIDKTRNSLKQLEAFQRVLKEEYPVANFSGRNLPPGQSHSQPLPIGHHVASVQRNQTKSKNHGLKFNQNKNSRRNNKINPFSPTQENKYNGEMTKKKDVSVHFVSDASYFTDPNMPDHGRCIEVPRGDGDSVTVIKFSDISSETNAKVDDEDASEGGRVKGQEALEVQNSKLLREILESETSLSLHGKDQGRVCEVTPVDLHNSAKEKPRYSVDFAVKSDADFKQGLLVAGGSHREPNTVANTSLQSEAPLSSRKIAFEKMRQDRKEKMTQRIYTRGFDMKTLQWDIDRKLVLMDPDWERRKIQKQLLSESRDTVDRLISRNREKFNHEIMGPRKAEQSSTQPTSRQPFFVQPIDDGEAGQNTSSGDNAADNSSDKLHQSQTTQVTSLNPLLHKVPLF